MTSGFRRTAEGIEVTHRTVRALVGLAVLVAGAVAFGLRTTDKVHGAVQQAEFRDTTRAIRSDLQSLGDELQRTSRATLALQCRQADYPAGFCDDVPRARAAGRDGKAP